MSAFLGRTAVVGDDAHVVAEQGWVTTHIRLLRAPTATFRRRRCAMPPTAPTGSTSLLRTTDHAPLAGVIVEHAEALVHLYGSCDRGAVYPQLGRGARYGAALYALVARSRDLLSARARWLLSPCASTHH